jgi:hypothetical protein
MSKRNPDIEATDPDVSLSGNSSKTDLNSAYHREDANATNLCHQ